MYAINATFQLTTTEYIKVSGENGKEELVMGSHSYDGSYDAKSLADALKTDVMINQLYDLLYERTGVDYGREQIRNAIEVKETDTDDLFVLEVPIRMPSSAQNLWTLLSMYSPLIFAASQAHLV